MRDIWQGANDARHDASKRFGFGIRTPFGWVAPAFLAVCILPSSGHALQIQVTASALRHAVARTTMPAEKLAAAARNEQAAAPSRVVLSVLLGPGEEARQVRAPWPVHLLGTGFYRGYGIAQLAILERDLPPGLAATTTLDIETGAAAEAPVQTLRPDASRDSETRHDIERLVLNPGDLARYAPRPQIAPAKAEVAFLPTTQPSLEGSPVAMLILTREALLPAFQAYADYKTGLGTPTVVRSIEWVLQSYPRGADLQETLRGFIRQAYQLWGIRYLLLGGDTDIVPARFASSVYTLEGESVPTDLYYACLDGSWNGDRDDRWGEGYVYSDNSSDGADLYPELYVGRVSAETPADVTQYLAKLRAYCEPTVSDYQHKLLFLAEVIWPAAYKPGDSILKNGADNAERLIVYNSLVRPSLTLTKLYETPTNYAGAVALTRAGSISSMNAGYGLVTDIGHGFRYTMSLGDASLTNLQAATLTNASRPFFLNMLNCSAAAFDFPCLAEKFLMNPSGGAVGVIGSAREAYPDNIQLFQEGWFQSLFREGYSGAAEALHQSRLRYLSLCYDDGAYRWSNFILAYFGDPDLPLWTAAPRAAAVTNNNSVPTGLQTFTVQVQSGGAAVPNATVTLWKQGDLYVTARTNLSGTANLRLNVEAPGTVQLTVSGAGLIPYRGTVQALPALGATLRSTGHVQVLDSGAGTQGNGNGVLETGETTALRFEVKNEGGTRANGVWLTAQCTDPGLTVASSSAQVGDLSPGSSAFSQSLTATVASQVVDLRHVGIDLVLHTVEGWSWSDRVYVDLTQPAPQVLRTWIDDKTQGNSDGVVQANEVYTLRVDLKNYGFGRLDAGTGMLLSQSPNATVLAGSTNFGNIDHLATVSGSFQVRESSVAQPNRMLLLVQNSFGRSWTFNIETRRPSPPSGVAYDPSGGAGIMTFRWTASPTPDVLGYYVYRSTQPFGPWDRASADLIQSATYFRDDGLQAGTHYYYNVTAVDSSRLESTHTATVAVTTNPQQSPGWPQLVGQWTNCSPVVANLKGDAKKQILAGADRLYAWNADGSEVRDGDANGLTRGIFTGLGSTYTAALAVGDLEHDGRDEVVACSWDTHEVYVFEGDGSVRPGWPRHIVSTTMGIWAAPAIADLDNDGRFEIIVLALDGRLYAWHADGSEVLDGDQNPATQGVFFVIPGNGAWSRGAPVVGKILTGDPYPQIVFGTETGRIYMLRANGSIAPGWPRIVGDRVTAAPSLGDIDHDGKLDIAIPARDGFLYVMRGDASDLPGWPRAFDSKWGSLTPSVALADFDHDGKLELVVGGTNGDTSNGGLWMFDSQGNVKPGWPVDLHTASEGSPVIGDLDGDAVPEILYGGESGILYGLRPDGTTFPGFPITLGAEVRSTPTITDLDGDGRVDVVLAGWDQQVYVWKFGGLFIRQNTPWAMFKGNPMRNGLYQYQVPTDASPGTIAPPARTALYANVPNPFNPTTRIAFDVAGDGAQRARLSVYDVHGRLVRTLLDRALAPGRYTQTWDGRDDRGHASSSGIYFSRLETSTQSTARKMVLVR